MDFRASLIAVEKMMLSPQMHWIVFSRRACPIHGTCLDFTSLYWLMWFDSLPLLGPGGLAIFLFLCFFCVCVFFFEREISKHQVSRRTPYPFNAASDSNRRECVHCCWGGWFWVLMRAPACLEPSQKYQTTRGRLRPREKKREDFSVEFLGS